MAARLPVVRVSMGWFPPGRLLDVERLMDYADGPLAEAIRGLPGLVSFHSGIDRERHAVVNVSVWDTLEAAEQMSSLQPMLDAGAALRSLGVKFVRPIVNASTLWAVSR